MGIWINNEHEDALVYCTAIRYSREDKWLYLVNQDGDHLYGSTHDEKVDRMYISMKNAIIKGDRFFSVNQLEDDF
jgi:hypothetical protein